MTMEPKARTWEKQASLYRTFQAESEVAIAKFHTGQLDKPEFDLALAKANQTLDEGLQTLRAEARVTNPTGKNQHEWGIIAQAHDPYREFHWCECCRKFRDADTGKLYTKTEFRHLTAGLTLYQPDSSYPFDIGGY